MKSRLFAGILIILVFTAALLAFSTFQGKSEFRPVDRIAGQRVADLFMSDLVANQIDGALSKMEPEFVHSVGKGEAQTQIQKLFDYCGRPLDSEFKHDEMGLKLYADGHSKPMRKFFYAARTTQHSKGECFFSVEVVPDGQKGYTVTSFGNLKLISGQLPAWLR